MCYSRPVAYAYLPNFVSIVLFCRPLAAKNPNCAIFSTSTFIGVASWHLSLRKLSMCAQPPTFPYPTVLKSFLCSNAFMAKSGARTLTFKSVTDKQTKRQKTQRFWPLRLLLISKPHQTWHDDTGPKTCSCTSKTFWDLTHNSPLGGAENLGITRPRQLKTAITQ